MDKDYKNEFYAKYNEILPEIMEFEPLRKEYRTKYFCSVIPCIVIWLTVVLVSVYSVIFLKYAPVEYEGWLLLGNIFGIPVSGFLTIFLIPIIYEFNKKLKPFSKKLKDMFTGDLLSVFKMIRYNKKVDKQELKNLLNSSNIFPYIEHIHFDDIFSGRYKDVNFNVFDLKLGDIVNLPCFNGVVLCYEFNKPIYSNTIISAKNSFNIKNVPGNMWLYSLISILYIGFSIFFIIYGILCSGEDWSFILLWLFIFVVAGYYLFRLISRYCISISKYQKIKLEDVEFDKKFKVFSDNQIEARYLLTTGFVDRFQKMQTAFGTKNIKCSFVGDKIIFAISTKEDSFEIGNVFIPLDKNNKLIEKFYNEIVSIYEMIEYFKLNERTGL